MKKLLTILSLSTLLITSCNLTKFSFSTRNVIEKEGTFNLTFNDSIWNLEIKRTSGTLLDSIYNYYDKGYSTYFVQWERKITNIDCNFKTNMISSMEILSTPIDFPDMFNPTKITFTDFYRVRVDNLYYDDVSILEKKDAVIDKTISLYFKNVEKVEIK